MLDFNCPCGCGSDCNLKFALIRQRVIFKMLKLGFGNYISSSLARCETYNRKVGGSVKSAHILGLADDVVIFDSVQRYNLVKTLMSMDVRRIFINFEKNILHWDIGTKKQGYTQNCLGKD